MEYDVIEVMSSSERVEVIRLTGRIIGIIIILIPIIIYMVSRIKLKSLNLNDEEYKEKSQKYLKNFKVGLLIFGVLGFAIFIVSGWVIDW